MQFLRNSVHRIAFSNEAVLIGGLDKEFGRPFVDSEGHLEISSADPTIILSHSPLVFDALDENSAALVLSGDTHGGQIPIPVWLWKMLGYEKNAKYNQGWYKEGKKWMYVSLGIGTSHWPIRILRRPEVVVLHF